MTSHDLQLFAAEPQRTHLSELELDRALLGAARETTGEHLATCATCRDRLTRLETAQAALGGSARVGIAAETASRSLGRGASRWLRPARLVPVVGGALAILVLALILRPGDDGGGLREKGGPSVQAFVQRHDHDAPEPWSERGLDPGDAVQLAYHPAGYTLVSVFVVEHGCQARLERSEPALAQGGLIASSWALDGPSGDERLYVAFSTRPIAPDALEVAMRATPGACTGGRAPDVAGDGFLAKGLALRGGGSR